MQGLLSIIEDALFVPAHAFLAYRTERTRNVGSLSYRYYEMMAVASLARYVHFPSSYAVEQFVTKIIMVLVYCYFCLLLRLRKPFLLSYNQDGDSFPHYWLYLLAALMTLCANWHAWLFGFLSEFSDYLEPLALVPQVWMVARTGNVENFSVMYAGLHLLYSVAHFAFNAYLISTGSRAHSEAHWVASVTQIVLGCVFVGTVVREMRKYSKMISI